MSNLFSLVLFSFLPALLATTLLGTFRPFLPLKKEFLPEICVKKGTMFPLRNHIFLPSAHTQPRPGTVIRNFVAFPLDVPNFLELILPLCVQHLRALWQGHPPKMMAKSGENCKLLGKKSFGPVLAEQNFRGLSVLEPFFDPC